MDAPRWSPSHNTNIVCKFLNECIGNHGLSEWLTKSLDLSPIYFSGAFSKTKSTTRS